MNSDPHDTEVLGKNVEFNGDKHEELQDAKAVEADFSTTDRAVRHHASNDQPGLASSGYDGSQHNRGSLSGTLLQSTGGRAAWLTTGYTPGSSYSDKEYRGDKYHLFNENCIHQ
ncbi:hypothetical protein AAVH_20775 [Aphelenchoides avenae]|nr:hypothetical protein AAVH_20775 [Aphelenchus avenae]